MRRITAFVLLALTLLWAVPALAQQPYPLEFTPYPCPFPNPTTPNIRLECGSVTLPQDRAKPDAQQVEVAVAIFRAVGIHIRPDPLIYLDGGPGSYTIERWGPLFDTAFAPFADQRDIILIDYRGTGYSRPNLICTEQSDYTHLYLQDANVDDDQLTERYLEATENCRQRLVNDGVDLGMYTSAILAQDVVDVWTALGYNQVNLLGISYGSRLALTLMRDHPQAIRSVIIDGVYPPQVSQQETGFFTLSRVLEEVFTTCAADTTCAANYPNLREVTYELAFRLQEALIDLHMSIPDEQGSPQNYTNSLNGVQLFNTFQHFLYYNHASSILPRIIYQAYEDGNFEPFNYLASQPYADLYNFSGGLNVTINCNEELPFVNVAKIIESARQYPELVRLYGFDESTFSTGEILEYVDFCSRWHTANPDPIENQAVSSDIPVLITSGQFDPVTPPEWAELAAQTLSNHYRYTFPGMGHGVMLSGLNSCPVLIGIAFLNNPAQSPDSGCIQHMQVSFDTPISRLHLIVQTNNNLGLRYVYPKGWVDTSGSATVFQPSRSSRSGIMYAPVFNQDARYYIDSVKEFYKITQENLPERVVIRSQVWTINRMYSGGNGYYINIAYTVKGDNSVVIITFTPDAAENQVIYEQFLLPALGSVRIN